MMAKLTFENHTFSVFTIFIWPNKTTSIMKRLLLILLISPLFAVSQIDTISSQLPYVDEKVVFNSINVAPSSTQQQIYAAAKKWIVDNFKNSKAVIQTEDIATGQILGKGIISVPFEMKGKSHYYDLSLSIQIDCKPEKFRIRFYNLILVSIPSVNQAKLNIPIEEMDSMTKKQNKDTQRWDEVKKNTNKKMSALVTTFGKTIALSKSDEF